MFCLSLEQVSITSLSSTLLGRRYVIRFDGFCLSCCRAFRNHSPPFSTCHLGSQASRPAVCPTYFKSDCKLQFIIAIFIDTRPLHSNTTEGLMYGMVSLLVALKEKGPTEDPQHCLQRLPLLKKKEMRKKKESFQELNNFASLLLALHHASPSRLRHCSTSLSILFTSKSVWISSLSMSRDVTACGRRVLSPRTLTHMTQTPFVNKQTHTST